MKCQWCKREITLIASPDIEIDEESYTGLQECPVCGCIYINEFEFFSPLSRVIESTENAIASWNNPS